MLKTGAIRILAEARPLLLDELGVGAAVLLTMGGVALHMYRSRHRMSVEERVKDSKMTETEARRQIRFYERCAPAVTALGVALLALAILDLAT